MVIDNNKCHNYDHPLVMTKITMERCAFGVDLPIQRGENPSLPEAISKILII